MSYGDAYHETVGSLAGDAARLEQVYQEARKSGESAAFEQAIRDSHEAAPDNLLYAAWFHRLRHGAARAASFAVAWAWVIPLALLNGLLFWWLSDESRYMIEIVSPRPDLAQSFFPAVGLLAAPLSAAWILIYFTAVGQRHKWRLSVFIVAALVAACAYVLLTYPQAGTRPFQEQYLTLMMLHLPLLAWAGVGGFLVAEHRDPANIFAFLIKSLELFVMAGLFVIAGGLFTGITVGLFDAIGIGFSEPVMRLFAAGGAGLIPVVAAAVIYNPTLPPAEQPFDEGLSRLVALIMRVLLPLTLLVLLVYLAFIPFNFRAPFENRDVLIVYNAMLFAVIALLVGATPVSLADLSPRVALWLRRAIIAVAALALLVSVYALAAILYRTGLDRLTPNRLTFIGWNVINLALLSLLLLWQARAGVGRWLHGLHRAYSAGASAYVVWTVVVILALPWLFRPDQQQVEQLPPSVQTILFEEADPILLKCAGSPHIYLLQDGEKRWIQDIETFNASGYLWRDVSFIACADLAGIPDGVPIPETAGPPPQP